MFGLGSFSSARAHSLKKLSSSTAKLTESSLPVVRNSARTANAPRSCAAIATLVLCEMLALRVDAQSNSAVAAYSFDANSGTSVADVTGNGNTINLYNGPTWTSGKYAAAALFDGSNDVGVAVAANPSLNLLGRSFTLSAWINPRSNNAWQMIVNKPYGASHTAPFFDWSLHREISSGRIVAFLGCEQRPAHSSLGDAAQHMDARRRHVRRRIVAALHQWRARSQHRQSPARSRTRIPGRSASARIRALPKS